MPGKITDAVPEPGHQLAGLRGLIRGPASNIFEQVLKPDPARAATVDLPRGVAFTGSQMFGDPAKITGIDNERWHSMYLYQQMIKFVHEAIEWENILYFLYPYFWDEPQAWDFVRHIQHPDATRQAFLRAWQRTGSTAGPARMEGRLG